MITAIIPRLPAINLQQTEKFYTDVLGAKTLSRYPDYVILSIEGHELHFFSYPSLDPAKSDFMVYIRVRPNIEERYTKMMQNSAPIPESGRLKTQPWGQIEFSILDPNGTLLTFGQAMPMV